MKKLFFFVFLCASIFFLTKKNYRLKLDPLFLNNIEAIASDEHADRTNCAGLGTVDCPVSHVKVDRIYGGYSLQILY